jgi:hypothetical protein
VRSGAIRCETKHAVLPRLGRIKLHEDASGLVGKVDGGTARVMSAAIRFERGRWFVSFTVDMARLTPTPAMAGSVVGVDLGIKTLVVLSSGEQIPNPRHCNGGEEGPPAVPDGVPQGRPAGPANQNASASVEPLAGSHRGPGQGCGPGR